MSEQNDKLQGEHARFEAAWPEISKAGIDNGWRGVAEAAWQAAQVEPHSISMPEGLHPATADLVLRFAQALAEKLHKAEQKYGYSDGWLNNNWMDECRAKLIEHVGKGDPRDVAAYCAFLWHHGERTELERVERVERDAKDAARYRWILNNAKATDALWEYAIPATWLGERHISNAIDAAIASANREG